MAGIGFELRRLVQRPSLFSAVLAYGYAGLISSGPWIVSILGIQVIGLLNVGNLAAGRVVDEFQVSVTYLMVASLTFTGLLQLAFTRYIADRIFERKVELVFPSLMGALQLTLLSSAVLGSVLLLCFFRSTGALYRLLMLLAFVVLCAIWITAIFLSSLKAYKRVFFCFLLGYGITIAGCYTLQRFRLEGLMLGFVLGHGILLIGMLAQTAREYPIASLISFDFLRRGRLYPGLMLIGLLYYAGLWVDKFVFWFNPNTSVAIIGPLRASPVYDLPVFLAYLSIIPGMAVFLMRIETDFAEHYQQYYQAVRTGGTLQFIRNRRNGMVFSIRQGLEQIIKVQTLAVLFTVLAGPELLKAVGISSLYQPLLNIQVVGAGLQVVFLALINIFFYLDKRAIVLKLTIGFCLGNLLFTLLSHYLGAHFYGYGFALAMLLVVIAALIYLNRTLDALEYETFMLQ